MARQALHLAGEVNSGKKDVSFLPRGFDVSLLSDEKRAEFETINKDVVGVAEESGDNSKTKEKSKRG